MKKWKWLTVFIVALVFIVLVVPFLSRGTLTQLALKKAGEVIGAPVEISHAELDLLRGGVTIHHLKIFNPLRRQEIFTAIDTLTLRLPLLPLLKGERGTLSISIRQPVIHYRTNASGNWELKNKLFPSQKKEEGKTELPFHLSSLTVDAGTIYYHDGNVGKTITLSPLNLKVKNLSSFWMETGIDQKGKLRIEGNGNLLAEKISFEADMRLEGLPLVPYEPYYEDPKLPVKITAGNVSLSSKAGCEKNYLRAPVHASIHQLEVEPKRNILVGLAADRLLEEIKNKEGNLELDFLVEGNLYNPQFHITTNLTKAFGKAVASTLIKEVPQTIEKVKELGGEVRSTIESIKQGDVQEGIESGVKKLKGIFGR